MRVGRPLAVDDRPSALRVTPDLAEALRLAAAAPTDSHWRHNQQLTTMARSKVGDSTATCWIGRGLDVISSAVMAEYQGDVVMTCHVSVAVRGHERRPTDAELAHVRADFGMLDAEEDNHSPGVARHLFCPLHLPPGTTGICECKEDEEQVVEPDGYRWSRPRTTS